MNSSKNILLFAALIALAFPRLQAASSSDHLPFAYKVSEVVLPDSSHAGRLVRGDSRNTVRAALGQAPRQLSPDVWVYPGFGGRVAKYMAPVCEDLVVTFAEDRVVDLKLVNAPAVRVIAASLRPKPVIRHVAGKKP